MYDTPYFSLVVFSLFAPGISMVIFSLVLSIIRESDISMAPVATDNFDKSSL